eukprot:m.104041 g.104041  ORF g.104041 m.104041 type:complete len:445 (+) comp15738_c0_seq1:117-1451(+)
MASGMRNFNSVLTLLLAALAFMTLYQFLPKGPSAAAPASFANGNNALVAMGNSAKAVDKGVGAVGVGGGVGDGVGGDAAKQGGKQRKLCPRVQPPLPKFPEGTIKITTVRAVWETGCEYIKSHGTRNSDPANSQMRIKGAFFICDTLQNPKLAEFRFDTDDDLLAATLFARDDGWLEDAYVGAITRASDIPMYERVINATHIFTTRPIVIVVCDEENLLPIHYDRSKFPRLIVVRTAQEDNQEFSKLRVLGILPVMYTQFLDPGTLPFGTADLSFTRIREESVLYDLPILPRHTDPIEAEQGRKGVSVKDVAETSPFLRDHVMMSFKAMPRMVQLYQRCRRGFCVTVEGAFNRLLWELGGSKYFCRIDPEYTLVFPPHKKALPKNHMYAFRFVSDIPNPSEADRTLAELIRLDTHCVNPLFFCNGAWSHAPDPACVNEDPGCLL